MWREACEGVTRVRVREEEGDQRDQGVKEEVEEVEEGRERFC